MSHLSRNFRFLFTLFLFVAFSFSFGAQIDYQAAADEIGQRLDSAVALYQQGKIDEAKRTVQMAYFGVYEGLEGPIRINYSQQYSAELEAKFGEIRTMITGQQPVNKIEAQVQWLKDELNTLPQKLEQGHQLIAEGNGLDADTIAPKWQKIANQINENINASVWAYKNGEQEKALNIINDTLNIYTQSGLPKLLGENSQTEVNKEILGYFTEMNVQMRLNLQKESERGQQIKAIAYQGYLLTQMLSEVLPDLPIETAIRPIEAPTVVSTLSETAVVNRDWTAVNSQILNAIDEAIAQYRSGEIDEAIATIQDSYFDIFEATGYENSIGAKDSGFKTRLESYFTKMVSLMNTHVPVADIVKVRDEQSADLTKAAEQLGSITNDFWSVFAQAFLILIREGLEAMLVVAAIGAYLLKNGHKDKMWVVKQSVGTGLIASLVTAYVFKIIFTNSGVSREILEGVTMLITVVVLFFMSYWLLSKVEAKQWQAYLKNTLAGSLSKGSVIGLWLASFLAVYREGAETVLFYFALSAGGGSVASIFTGIVVASVVLLVIYFIMRFTVVQLPLKPFFMFTGLFMYVMAFIFTGKGVMELVEGKVIAPTIILAIPEIHWLGIFPYFESLALQTLLIMAAIVAWVVIRLRAKRA